MPGEGALLVGGFDDVLLIEEVNLFTQHGAGYLVHEIAKQKVGDDRIFQAAVGNEIPLFVMVDAIFFQTFGFHFGIKLGDVLLAFVAQTFEDILGNDAFQDKVAIFAKLFELLWGDLHADFLLLV